ncbi:MAG: exosortase K [Pyrinomonadaceae bacterium]
MFSEPGALKMGEMASDGAKLAMFRSYVCKTLERAREMEHLSQQKNYRATAQLGFVLLSAVAIKWYYATANVNQLRWILAPTTWMVEFITGASFEFESYTGYMSSDRTFVIAASCAGVNFLITSFLMLSLRKLWTDRATKVAWRFFAVVAVAAYVATIIANTVRISSALLLRRMPVEIGLGPDQLHRFEGILIYFGFLLLLFLVSEKVSDRTSGANGMASAASGVLRQAFFPLLIYYGTTLGLPLANGAYRQGFDFLEHAAFVLATPLLLLLPVLTFQFCRTWRGIKN